MVIFRSADGKPGYHQAETLEEAVAFVERLRNEEQVTDARVFRMDEVPIEFQVYYRVAVAAAPVAGAGDDPAPAGDGDAGEPADGDGEAGAANGAGGPGRLGRFART